jgi:RNase P subunit RPR2
MAIGFQAANILFVWLISHQPAVLFSQNKSATRNQLASSTFLSQQISISHPPPAKRTGCKYGHSLLVPDG